MERDIDESNQDPITDSGTPTAAAQEVCEAPRGLLPALDELLRKPGAIVGRADRLTSSSVPWLVAGALACFVAYGAVSGFFQGGGQILVTALKAPLIVMASLLLCVPSLYVLASLAGVEVSPRWLVATVAGLVGTLGLLLVALMPITWLFSVSTASLAFMTILQVIVWTVAVFFGFEFLNLAFHARGATRPSRAWVLVFLLVSFQVASQMRPVLWRGDDVSVFAPRKMFFLEHFTRIVSGKDGVPPPATEGD